MMSTKGINSFRTLLVVIQLLANGSSVELEVDWGVVHEVILS
jgi:hypothetical protein